MVTAQFWPGGAGLLLVGIAVGAGLVALVSLVTRRRGSAGQARVRRAALVLVIIAAFLGVVAIAGAVDPRLPGAAAAATAARVISAFPDVVVAVVVVVMAVIIAPAVRAVLERLVRPLRAGWSDAAGALGHWSVIVLAVVVAASQVGLAVGVLERLLLIGVGGVLLAGAVGLGLGSRELVGALVAGRHAAAVTEVGDEVEVDGIRGRVLAVGRVSVRVSVSNAVAEVPNARFLEGVVLVHERAGDETVAPEPPAES